ncbi:MAG: threonine/serine dehydratase [Chloroflexota bacterium]
MLTLADIRAAQDLIAPHLTPTPLELAPELGQNVYLKLENANLTHSFKIRGALNAALALDAPARARGLVAASSGNHAQGLAYAAKLVGAPAKIYMPQGTPARKVNGVRRYGAEPVIFGATYDEAEAEARRVERDEGRTFVSAYNDPFVAAGQGTIGMEILAQLPQVQRVLVCVSGGGLIAGIAAALKLTNADIEVIGVGAAVTPAMYNIFHGTDLPLSYDTLAEALLGDVESGSMTIPEVQTHVDDIVSVSEDAIAGAMRWSVLHAGWVVEGGGTVGIAAVRSGAVTLDERPTAIVVSGGNVDAETLQRVLCEK